MPTEADFTAANRETSFGAGSVPATINIGDTYTHQCKNSFIVLGGSGDNNATTVECMVIDHWDDLTRTTYLSITAIPDCSGKCCSLKKKGITI